MDALAFCFVCVVKEQLTQYAPGSQSCIKLMAMERHCMAAHGSIAPYGGTAVIIPPFSFLVALYFAN